MTIHNNQLRLLNAVKGVNQPDAERLGKGDSGESHVCTPLTANPKHNCYGGVKDVLRHARSSKFVKSLPRLSESLAGTGGRPPARKRQRGRTAAATPYTDRGVENLESNK